MLITQYHVKMNKLIVIAFILFSTAFYASAQNNEGKIKRAIYIVRIDTASYLYYKSLIKANAILKPLSMKKTIAIRNNIGKILLRDERYSKTIFAKHFPEYISQYIYFKDTVNHNMVYIQFSRLSDNELKSLKALDKNLYMVKDGGWNFVTVIYDISNKKIVAVYHNGIA
jgi:hypothetical protein